MKVGLVTEWFERGSSYVSLAYKSTLEMQGHCVHVYARCENQFLGEPLWEGEKVHKGKKSPLPFGKAVDKKDFLEWLRTNELDVVIFNEQIWPLPVYWAQNEGVLTVGYIDYYTKKNIRDFKIYDLLICNSKQHVEAFKWHRNIRYIPWGVDLSLFHPGPDVNRELTFFHSAGWSPYRKGTDLLVKSFLMLESKSKLVIHLQIPVSKFLAKFEIDTSHPRFKDIEFFEGSVAPPGLYHLGDVYVYPSRLDGIGLTQAEALACGLPIISTGVEPMTTFSDHGYSKSCSVARKWYREDQYFWPMAEVDIQSLVADMRYFETNLSQRSAWKAESRNWAMQNLDWKQNSSQLGAILMSLAKTEFSKMEIVEFRIRNFEFLAAWRMLGILWLSGQKIREILKRA